MMVIGFGNTKMERTLPISKGFSATWTDKPKEIPQNPKRKVSGRELLAGFKKGF